jgi:nonsense-mediated mRNA decay protein 3
MSEGRGFCPRCGDAVERPADVDLPGARGRQQQLCDPCYFEQFDLVDAPDRVHVRVCSQCGAVHRGNRWVDVDADDYTDVAVEEVADALSVHVDAGAVEWGVRPEQVDETTVRMHARVSGVVRGTAVEAEVTVPVKIARETCQRCGRIAGDYYAGVVQVRATDRAPGDREVARTVELAHEVVGEMEATGDREAFVTEVTEHDDGVDVKLSTNKIGEKVARRVVAEFGGTVEDHETLVTEDEDGNEVYRVTFAVRLPPYRPGDVIDPEDGGGPVLVESAHGTLEGTRLATGEAYEADYEDGAAPEARSLGRVEEAVETTLVTVEDDNAVQVLDPETRRAETIPRPGFVEVDAATVPVFKSQVGLHPVPPEAVDDA